MLVMQLLDGMTTMLAKLLVALTLLLYSTKT